MLSDPLGEDGGLPPQPHPLEAWVIPESPEPGGWELQIHWNNPILRLSPWLCALVGRSAALPAAVPSSAHRLHILTVSEIQWPSIPVS